MGKATAVAEKPALSFASFKSAKRDRRPRIILLGTEKVGKSEFASQAPGAIFIPVVGEEGIDALDVMAAPVASTYSEVMESLGVLFKEAPDDGFAVIDSASTLEPLIHDHTCKTIPHEKGHKVDLISQYGFGKGFENALHYWRELTDGLDLLRNEKNIGSIIIGHVKVKPFNDPMTDPYDQYIFDIHKDAASLLTRWADCILFANRKAVIREVGDVKDEKKKVARHAKGTSDRFLYTDKRPAHPGGGRGVYGQLPYELPLTWQAFQDAIAKASAE